MNKKRLIGKIILHEGISVQSLQYNNYLPLGSPKISAEYLDKWGIDEIIILDIDATKKRSKPNFKLIREISKIIRTPLTVGGGIRSINDVYSLIRSGADKVSINSSFLKNPKIIKKASRFRNDDALKRGQKMMLSDEAEFLKEEFGKELKKQLLMSNVDRFNELIEDKEIE